MIHDATIEITCDTCQQAIISNDADIEAFLEHEGWYIDGDKHYCQAGCVPAAEADDGVCNKPSPEVDRCGGVSARIFTPQIKGV